jgi:tetratricopeptide (TPR) repeat protein/DNA-binding CsgD family transcriptional regulator
MRIIIFIFLLSSELIFSQAPDLEQRLENFIQDQDRSNVIKTYVELVRYNRVLNPKLAIKYAFDGITYIGEDESDIVDLGHLYAKLGNLLGNQGLVEKSIEYHKEAIRIYSKSNARNHIAWRHLDIGTIYFNKGILSSAENRYNIALEIFTSLSHLAGMAVTENNLGLIKQQNYQPTKAILHYEKALEYRKTIGKQYLIGHSISNLGRAYVQLKKYSRALELFEEANSILETSNGLEEIIGNYENMADLYSQIGDNEIAIYYHEKSILLSEQNNIMVGLPAIHFALGNIYNNQNKYNLAIKYFKKGLEIAKQTGSLPEQSKLYKAIHLLLKESDVDQSLNLLVEYSTIQDSLHVMKNLEILTQIEISRIMVENEQAISRKALEVEKQKTYRNIIGIGLIISLIFLFLLINRYYYIKRTSKEILRQKGIIHKQEITVQKEKEVRLQNDIAFKHKELTSKALNMSHTQEIFSNLATQLKTTGNGSSPAVKKSLELIQKQLHSENEWNEFQKWFSEVHNDFYRILIFKFPTLSQREQKICALLKLKLSTKDIASLTNLSPGSIEQYRIKIRKQMGIARSVNLTEFIDSL